MPGNDLFWRVVAYGLTGAPALGLDGPPSPALWAAVLDQAVEHRLIGHLVFAVRAGDLVLTDSQRAELSFEHERAMAGVVVLERLMLDVNELLAGQGITVVVMKGPALAHRVYPDPAWRTFGDIDLLVSGAAFDSAIAVLGDLGWRRSFDDPRPGFTNRFGKGVAMVGPDGLEVDVHRSFAAGPFGLTVDPSNAITDSVEMRVGDRSVRVLSPIDQFIGVCIHAVLGARTPRPVPLRDVAQCLLVDEFELGAVIRRSAAWQCDVVVARALQESMCRLSLPGGFAAAWATARTPNRREQRMLAPYRSKDRDYARQAAAGVLALPTLRSRVAYARALLFPSRSYLRTRDGSYLRRVARGVRLAAQSWSRG